MASKSPISMLQEILASKQLGLPEYTFDSIGNLLQPRFSCVVKSALVTASGEAGNKKDAKHEAALNALLKMGIKFALPNNYHNKSINTVPSTEPPKKLPEDFVSVQNYVGLLNEYAAKMGSPYASYEESLFAQDGQFQCICKFGDIAADGFGTTKKQAKQVASFEMLSKLKFVNQKSNSQPAAKKVKDMMPNLNDIHIIEKFKTLCFSDKIKSAPSNALEGNELIQSNKYTVEDALDEITKWGYKCELTVLEENPFQVVAEIKEKGITLFGLGGSEDDATRVALNETLEVLKQGCKKFDLKEE